ncbi:transglutaminase domain-containing protein [Tenacibaculum tangerinum]|uniref:Transglutaminase domain-containing protein n=1 Tax=Tenacibaculum tangerinum TaxID=3038772 RepID=A0ABY8L1S8_9FLAO|nr:transglutaminase domain-containing protein [Tenacibaculum tangerinum]WGH75398.1 transglutaminase domain-containing protein [Tenacibaculum tangerinum]
MKQLLFLFFLVTGSVSAQDFSLIEEKVNNYPQFKKVARLTQQIAKDFNTEEQQVQAAFYWLAYNIQYDLHAYYHPTQKRIYFSYRNEQEKLEKQQAIKDSIVNQTLTTRKAICEGYAQTFAKICSMLQIENEVIRGHIRNSSRDIGNAKPNANHAWNAVKLHGKWIYIDATWAAGVVNNNRWHSLFNAYYYNIPKEKYFKTHFPEEKRWQLRVGRTNKVEFYSQPIYNAPFLQSDLVLISPKKGILNGNKTIEIRIKNLKPSQKVTLGYSGYRYAVKPDKLVTHNHSTIITSTPRKNSNRLFLIIDKEVMLEFLIR